MRRPSSRPSITTITSVTIITRLAHNPAPRARVTRGRPAAGSGRSPQLNQMFKPYAQPGEGDDDGLSRDPDDCMKGCIGGAPQ